MRAGILLLATTAILYPLWVWYSSVAAPLNMVSASPAFGLFAFSLMWLHIIGGPFKPWLLKMFPRFDVWMFLSATAVTMAIILHPLLLLVGVANATGNRLLAFFTGAPAPIRLGVAAWFMFIFYDLARPFKKRLINTKAWYVISLIATLGFFLILFHSLALGSNLQSGPLHLVWMFYGATAAAAALYTYGIKPILLRSRRRGTEE